MLFMEEYMSGVVSVSLFHVLRGEGSSVLKLLRAFQLRKFNMVFLFPAHQRITSFSAVSEILEHHSNMSGYFLKNMC